MAPSVQERKVDDFEHAFLFAERLFAGEFDVFVAMTGVGLGYLRDMIATRYPLERFAEALRKTLVVARGPKPIPIFRQLEVPIGLQIGEPNTWREVAAALIERPEKRIALQEYGRPSHELVAKLEDHGAKVDSINIYRWELPDDIGLLKDAVRRIANRQCDVVVFTTSVQLQHLLWLAGTMGLEAQVREALANHMVVGSVGPIATASLEEQGIVPDIIPPNPTMGSLVKTMADHSHEALGRKRGLIPALAPQVLRSLAGD